MEDPVPETIEALKARIAKLEVALLAVERWSFDTATDLTDAGYGEWAPLLHGPRKPLSGDEALRLINEIEAADGGRIGGMQARIAADTTASPARRLRFHIMFDTQTRQIARGLRDATQLRLFLLLPSFFRWDAWHLIDEARIAAELEITPEEVRRALAEFVLRGLILRNDTGYRGTGWQLSSVWGRKGSFREVQADIAQTDRAPDAEAA